MRNHPVGLLIGIVIGLLVLAGLYLYMQSSSPPMILGTASSTPSMLEKRAAEIAEIQKANASYPPVSGDALAQRQAEIAKITKQSAANKPLTGTALSQRQAQIQLILQTN